LRLLIIVASKGFLKDKCGPRAKKFEHHWLRAMVKFTFCAYYVSTKPAAFPSCITVTLQEMVK